MQLTRITRTSFAALALCAALVPGAMHGQAPVRKIGVGLYGSNGHQIRPAKLADHPHARLIGGAGLRSGVLPEGARAYATLDEMLADPDVELVSLCSPRREDQARDAIRCLEAGRHVYAEKPVALTEPELDALLAAAAKSGREFHEMAGTAFAPHYAAMRRLVAAGAIGDVVQVFVQKTYRYGAARPQDEAIDGGMFLQVGIHAARMIEHVGGVRMAALTGWETRTGTPETGEGRIAGAAQAVLENGGLATIIMNYLNPAGTPLPHGNESLRIFGTRGYLESIEGGGRTRLVTSGSIVEPIEPAPAMDYFDAVAARIATGAPMPLTLEEELHPLRMLLRAKADIRAREQGSATAARAPAPRG